MIAMKIFSHYTGIYRGEADILDILFMFIHLCFS